MKNPTELNQRSRSILKALSGLSLADSMRLLGRLAALMLSRVVTGKSFLQRKRLYKIERDRELKSLVDGVYAFKTIDEVHAMCLAKFGSKRTPSRAAVGRYIRKIRLQGENFQ